jgi:hypothetical protein
MLEFYKHVNKDLFLKLNSSKGYAILIIVGLVFLLCNTRPPFLKNYDSIKYDTVRIIASSQGQTQYLQYYSGSIERISQFYSTEQFPREMNIFLTTPNDVFEPYTRAQLQGAGGYAIPGIGNPVLVNTSGSGNLLMYKPTDRRIFYYVDGILVHEIAHQWDFTKGAQSGRLASFIDQVGWKRGFPSLLPYYVIKKEDERQSTYGLTNPAEDLAETVSNVYSNPSILDSDRLSWFNSSFPQSERNIGLGFLVPENAIYKGYSQYTSSLPRYQFFYKTENEDIKPLVLDFYKNVCEVPPMGELDRYSMKCSGVKMYVGFLNSDTFYLYASN